MSQLGDGSKCGILGCPCGRIDIDDEPDDDPTRYCNACGARTAKECDCGPIAENN